MGKLLTAIVVLVLLLVAADVGARVYTQHQIEQRIDQREPGAQAKVTISGFPFLGRLLAGGRVKQITGHLAHAGRGDFVLDRVDISVIGVTINRSQFIRQRFLQIDHIDTGTVVAAMSQADFDRLVGLPLVFEQGAARATIAGVTATVRVSIVNNRLRVAAAGLPVVVPIPALPALPCAADVRIVPGHLVASCTFSEIPPAFGTVSP